MRKVGICLMVVLGMTQVAYAATLSLVQRKVETIADGYQITLGVDSTGSPEAVAGWQVACQISPDNLTVNVAEPDNYLFEDSTNYSFLYLVKDEFTDVTTFYGVGDPSQVPEVGSNLVRIDLTSSEPFNYDIVFIPYNDADESGSFWYTDPALGEDPVPRPFDLSSVPEPSCIRMLLCLGVVYLSTMARCRRLAKPYY